MLEEATRARPSEPVKKVELPKVRVPDQPATPFPTGAGAPPPGFNMPESGNAAEAFIVKMSPIVNFEANVFNLCYEAALGVLAHQRPGEMRDAVAIGESLYGAGSRTPLELAVPQIAIEIYRNVRQELRAQEDIKAKIAEAVEKIYGAG
jgi:hypothetical protein